MRTAEQGALMHVLATTVEALIVVCGPGPATKEATLSHIAAVDPPSAKVQLKEVCRKSCLVIMLAAVADVISGSKLTVHAENCKEPALRV